MKDILSLEQSELEADILAMGEKKFRALQIYQWLHKKRAASFDEMSNLSSELRLRLAEEYYIGRLKAVRVLKSKLDDT